MCRREMCTVSLHRLEWDISQVNTLKGSWVHIDTDYIKSGSQNSFGIWAHEKQIF